MFDVKAMLRYACVKNKANVLDVAGVNFHYNSNLVRSQDFVHFCNFKVSKKDLELTGCLTCIQDPLHVSISV